VSSPHPIKPAIVSAPAVTASVPRFSTRPVHPFSLSCAFDRQRGQFVVLAGARAGACAVVASAVLALGTFGFVRSAVFGGSGGPSTASASVTPPLASTAMSATTTTVTPTKPQNTEPAPKAKPAAKSAKAAKATKAAKVARDEAPLASATPAAAVVAPTIKHHTPAEPSAENTERQPGRDYLVVLTLRTKASAEKARETLLRKGVATTVERSLPGLSADRKYSLVGLTGFDPDSDRSKLDKQLKRLKALKLDAKPYTWRG
jgi:hypothetical protein